MEFCSKKEMTNFVLHLSLIMTNQLEGNYAKLVVLVCPCTIASLINDYDAISGNDITKIYIKQFYVRS